MNCSQYDVAVASPGLHSHLIAIIDVSVSVVCIDPPDVVPKESLIVRVIFCLFDAVLIISPVIVQESKLSSGVFSAAGVLPK